jgi:hypothetical protein
VEVPEINYLMIDGEGDPNTSTIYQAAVEVLSLFGGRATVERLHKFIVDADRRPSGKHHEIYLSDIKKAASEKWKTVIRHPMQ